MDDLAALSRRTGEGVEEWGLRLVDDLAARHRDGARWRVEAYLQGLPELATEPEVVLDLLVAEWTLRRRAGEPVAVDEYILRFPKLERSMREQWSVDQQTSLILALPSPLVGEGSRGGEGGREGEGRSLPAWYVDTVSFPAIFGRYRLLREFGGGGMARVFLAEPVAGGTVVALKVPTLPAGQDERADHERRLRRLRFRRETSAVAELNHPHLCKLLDVGEHDGLPFFTMPYYSRGSVAHELKAKGRFSQEEAARLVANVARALQHAHSRDVIHRDLKPSNLLRDESGAVVVADFGLAFLLDDDETRLTLSGTIAGTLAYLSPEQAEGSRQVTPASDVFSLGVVLYELVAGQQSFTGNVIELLCAIRDATPAPLENIRPDVSPALVAICRKAMAKRADDRYASMAAFADDLERFLAGTWSLAETSTNVFAAPTVNHPIPRRPRRWWAMGLVAATAGLLLGGLLLWVFTGNSAVPKQPSTEESKPSPQPDRPLVSKRQPIGLRGQLQLLHDDLVKLDAEVRPQVRYFSLLAVHDNPYVSDEELSLHRDALKQVLNRLSHKKEMVPVDVVGASGCLLRIDLRDLGWDADKWGAVLEAEPYGVRYDAVNPDELVRKLAREIDRLMESLEAPWARGDWFIEACRHAPLVKQLKGLPADPEDKNNASSTRVAELYAAMVDVRVAAAELGLGTATELQRRWPKGNPEMALPVSRATWSGVDGEARFARMVKTLKLGVPRAVR